MSDALHAFSAARFPRLMLGTFLARGARTVTAWIRAAGLSSEFRPAYTTLAAAGRCTDDIAAAVAADVVLPLARTDTRRVVVAIDDTPTRRYGPEVRGCGIHHNPTPGPAGSSFLYGHVWVVLAVLTAHPLWGMFALPLLARLYVRDEDLPSIPEGERPAFRTELQMAVEMLRWACDHLRKPGVALWAVADGAYAKAPVLKAAKALGVTFVSRLRRDSALHTVPGERPPGQRGPRRTYGEGRIDLAKRGGQKRGWTEQTFTLYGRPVTERYKTFLATWRPAGGAIRVVLVDEPTGWVAFFCTDTSATPAEVLGCVADRSSLETTFREVKQQVGAGEQQVRKVAANVGAFHACLWSYTLAEAWAWDEPAGALADRSGSPWDDPARRPSHADKRRALKRELLREEIRASVLGGANEAEKAAAIERILDLAA